VIVDCLGARAGAAFLAFVAPAILGCAFAASAAQAQPPVSHLGSGAREVWVFRPARRVTSIVVFGHGWSTPLPAGFGPWVEHLRARGSIVIYPRYREGAGDSTASALADFQAGVQSAFKLIRRVHAPVVAIGKSFGGSAVFYYAGSARDWGVPAPAAILSIFPAGPIGALPSARPAPRTFVEFFVGDADTTAGSGGANTFWGWLSGHPASRKRYVVIRSRPGFVANHDSAQRTDRIAQAVFWAPLDLLIARARAGR
jgi:acetyl esterase/lipase